MNRRYRRLELCAREQHERRRLGGRLGAEQDLRLLTAADRVRVRRDQLAQAGVQLPVVIRLSQPSSAASRAGTSRSTCQPVRAEMLTRGAQAPRTRSRSISRSR